ncbi:MAG: hypothetical protein HZA88_16940 [Verrucomicrobia bacterium]|nr:hypothetical protein [Verrucomicrobiota bacterium]
MIRHNRVRIGWFFTFDTAEPEDIIGFFVMNHNDKPAADASCLSGLGEDGFG